MTSLPLAGQNVLVTRPEDKGAHLATLVEAAGGVSTLYPLFEIVLQSNPDNFRRQWQMLETPAIMIFVSIPAVDGFFTGAGLSPQQLFADYPEVAIAAVGPGTAKRLEEIGVTTDFLPSNQFDSEGLLARLEMSQVAGKQVVIVRGDSGRETLAEGLSARGASVHYLQSYERRRINGQGQGLPEQWLSSRRRMAVVTSVEAVTALVDHALVNQSARLLATPLAVFSQRIMKHCRLLGFNDAVVVSDYPNSGSLVNAMVQLAKLSNG